MRTKIELEKKEQNMYIAIQSTSFKAGIRSKREANRKRILALHNVRLVQKKSVSLPFVLNRFTVLPGILFMDGCDLYHLSA